MHFIEKSWSEGKSSTIINCFHKAVLNVVGAGAFESTMDEQYDKSELGSIGEEQNLVAAEETFCDFQLINHITSEFPTLAEVIQNYQNVTNEEEDKEESVIETPSVFEVLNGLDRCAEILVFYQ